MMRQGRRGDLWTWPRSRCLRCGCTCVSLIILIISILFALRHRVFYKLRKCKDKESLEWIADYCQAYREGQITGSLCQPLCESRQVQFQSCTSLHIGKRVSVMSCSDFCVPGQTVSAVLKYPNDNISALLSAYPKSFPKDSETGSFYQHIGDMLRQSLSWDWGSLPLPFPPEANLMEVMWEKDSDKYTGSAEAQRVAFRSVRMLINQLEYRMGKALENRGVVPHIYGTCGAMYLQQFCPPAVLDEAFALYTDPKHTPVPWEQKAKGVIQLLQFIKRLDQDFPEVLHLCDVKESSFGVCADGSMKLIDADSVVFDNRKEILSDYTESWCQTHDDCNVLDCGMWCQIDTGKCYDGAITNNNLQRVCQKVFFSEIPKHEIPKHLGGGSIFFNAPASVAPKLQAVVEECLAHSSTEQGRITVHKPPLSLLTRLIDLLEHSLSQVHEDL